MPYFDFEARVIGSLEADDVEDAKHKIDSAIGFFGNVDIESIEIDANGGAAGFGDLKKDRDNQ